MMDVPPDPIATVLPARLRDLLAGYRWAADGLGRSSASVFRLEADGRPPLYLKNEIASPFSELAGEAARLRWLGVQGLACPTVAASYAAPLLSTLILTLFGFAEPSWGIALACLLVTGGAVLAAHRMILRRNDDGAAQVEAVERA
jgi:hypothetical protein